MQIIDDESSEQSDMLEVTIIEQHAKYGPHLLVTNEDGSYRIIFSYEETGRVGKWLRNINDRNSRARRKLIAHDEGGSEVATIDDAS